MSEDRPTDRTGGDNHAVSRSLRALTLLVTGRPWVALSLAGLLCVLCVGITARFLTFKANRADLIDPGMEFHQRWLNFVDRFGDDAEVVVVVQGEGEHQIRPVLDDLGAQLEAEPELFSRVLYRVDPRGLQRKALQYLSPEELERANARLEMYEPMLSGHWNRAGLESYAGVLAERINALGTGENPDELAGTLDQARRLSASLHAFLQDPNNFQSPWPEVISAAEFPQGGTLAPHYQITPSGTMGFVLATPRAEVANFSGGSTAITRLKELLVDARRKFPEVRIGLTGLPILEADEMRKSQSDMTLASLISFFGVGLILLAGFRGFRHPFLCMVMLAVAIAWCLGYTTLAVGHLNILSVSFAAILIGLGIDFSIHYLSRYLELRHHGVGLVEALVQGSGDVGTGIITAAVTTALAFGCAAFTRFLGVAELGIISGGGILICVAATFFILPPLIVLADRRTEPRRLPTPFEGRLLRRITRQHPWWVIAGSVAAVVAIGSQAFDWSADGPRWKVTYDSNLLNLQARGLESVELQQQIFDEANGSLLAALSIAESPQQARLLKEKFEALPEVIRVEDLASYLPSHPAAETNLLVQAIHARLSSLSELPREIPMVNPQSIGRSLELLYQSVRDRPEETARSAAQQLDGALAILEMPALEAQMQLLGGYQQGMLMSLHRQFQMLAAISDAEPVTAADFPAALSARFVSPGGDWLLRVYPREQVWDEAPLAQFVSAVRNVDPEATGTPLQNLEGARQIKLSYLNAATYAAAVIVVALLIDALPLGAWLVSLTAPIAALCVPVIFGEGLPFNMDFRLLIAAYIAMAVLIAAIFDLRGVRDVLLMLVPTVLGMALMFGCLGLLGIDLNPANMIVLPLILGIGVDNGVHIVHGFHMQKGAEYETAPSTINAIMLTSLTTMAGFGSMLVAAHRGLVSLGQVLVIGVGACLFLSLVFLPAVLTIISRAGRGSRRPVGRDGGIDEGPTIVPLRKARQAGVA